MITAEAAQRLSSANLHPTTEAYMQAVYSAIREAASCGKRMIHSQEATCNFGHPPTVSQVNEVIKALHDKGFTTKRGGGCCGGKCGTWFSVSW